MVCCTVCCRVCSRFASRLLRAPAAAAARAWVDGTLNCPDTV